LLIVKVKNGCRAALAATICFFLGCAGSGGSSELAIVASSGSLQGVVAGDVLALRVMDGAKSLPAGTTLTWSGVPTVSALDPSSTAASPLPAAGDAPTAAFVTNPGRPDVSWQLADVLFILDPGTKAGGELSVTATLTGTVTGTVTVSIPVGETPAGDATSGALTYGAGGANCASCHGATAHGTDAGTDGRFIYNDMSYAYPAPGLNAESGNVASDPAWNAALLAMAARCDMDNGGLTLRVPMPTFLATPNAATGLSLTARDFADIYAFVKTQTH
jgi:mono/diheme cytochrome c family protein